MKILVIGAGSIGERHLRCFSKIDGIKVSICEPDETKNIKILIDTFHMNIEEPSIYGSIVKSIPYLGHVHFADSNRHAPGRGHLDFMGILSILSESGYKGYISMEMLSLPDINETAEMAIRYVKNILGDRK